MTPNPSGGTTMSKNLEPGSVLPDFELPDEDGVRHACPTCRATT